MSSLEHDTWPRNAKTWVLPPVMGHEHTHLRWDHTQSHTAYSAVKTVSLRGLLTVVASLVAELGL